MAQPIAWNQTGDTAYTWYADYTLLKVLPTARTLAYNEVTAYYPVTAHTFSDIEVRYQGSVSFTYRLVPTYDPDYNSHQLFIDTENNTGDRQQVSVIKLVAYSGSSAYSATTVVTKNPADIQKNIYLLYNAVTATSADTQISVGVITQNCVFDRFTYLATGSWDPTPPLTKDGNSIVASFTPNTGQSRGANYRITLYDTDNNRYNAQLVIMQEEAAEPEPEPPSSGDSGDSGYTWYTDDQVLKILPTARTLAYDERTAYYPVTARTISNLEVRSTGDVDFTYQLIPTYDEEYNSHQLYVYTENNTGDTRQESTIEIVGYNGSSAYSASTLLFKNPESHAYITASPNPVNVSGARNVVSVYLTMTNCERSVNDELTGNTQLASWVGVERLSSTAISFTIQANGTDSPRSTYYMVYGRNPDNQLVYCRIDINQDTESNAITITPSRSSLSKAAGSFTCAISSTLDGSFTFSASPWMNITRYSASSQHSGTLYVDYYENNNAWPRTGEIRVFQQVSVSPYTLSASTTISQAINSGDSATLTVTPTTATVNRQAGSYEFEVRYNGLASVPGVIEGEGNMNITSYNYSEGIFTVSYGANNTSVDKNKTFYVTGTSMQGNILSIEVKLHQTGLGIPCAPVWRDYVLDMATPGLGYVDYIITFNGEQVYTGRSYAYPGATGATIFFNQLVKNFLSNTISFDPGYQTITDWLGNFTITSPQLGNIASVAFYEDYSYENRQMTNIMTLNNPITHEVPEGGLVPLSFFVTGETGTVQIRTNKRIE